MQRAFIYVDNLRLGGFQRLALDQAYALSDKGLKVDINVLSPAHTWVLADLERDLIDSKNITVNEIPSSRLRLIRNTHLQIKSIKNPLIISHSLRSTFALRISRLIRSGAYTINTTIHQLPGLTDPVQRLKRFLYAQFSDRLFCFSSGVKLSWDSQFSNSIATVLIRFTKQISVLRNGIYLDRLPTPVNQAKEIRRPRIVFLGRLAFWKGLDTIKKLSESKELNDFDFMFIIPGSQNSIFEELVKLLGNRAIVVEGKTVSSFIPMRGDVHIYPANYGSEVKIVESISLNCLEMTAIGVPSVVSSDGMVTWPEFMNSKFFSEVNWAIIPDVISQILKLSSTNIEESEISEARALISIENQLQELLKNK
jgi:glycosyltransferase involved in cell wall biosynthesis